MAVSTLPAGALWPSVTVKTASEDADSPDPQEELLADQELSIVAECGP